MMSCVCCLFLSQYDSVYNWQPCSYNKTPCGPCRAGCNRSSSCRWLLPQVHLHPHPPLPHLHRSKPLPVGAAACHDNQEPGKQSCSRKWSGGKTSWVQTCSNCQDGDRRWRWWSDSDLQNAKPWSLQKERLSVRLDMFLKQSEVTLETYHIQDLQHKTNH